MTSQGTGIRCGITLRRPMEELGTLRDSRATADHWVGWCVECKE